MLWKRIGNAKQKRGDEKKAIWDSHNHYYISREFHQSLNENTGQSISDNLSPHINLPKYNKCRHKMRKYIYILCPTIM